MWIKICGNTRLEDCLLAADLGADAIGFIFAAGKRTVTTDHVASITAAVPESIEKIGVFTSTDADAIAATALGAGLTGIQLHGRYDPALVTAVRAGALPGHSMRLLQVIHWELDVPAAEQLEDFATLIRKIEAEKLVDALLVDSRTAKGSGGTGRTFDWQAAGAALAGIAMPVIVAGGLNAANVTDAVTALRPSGVDVSSGVEDSPGLKSADALRRFIQNARTDR